MTYNVLMLSKKRKNVSVALRLQMGNGLALSCSDIPQVVAQKRGLIDRCLCVAVVLLQYPISNDEMRRGIKREKRGDKQCVSE